MLLWCRVVNLYKSVSLPSGDDFHDLLFLPGSLFLLVILPPCSLNSLTFHASLAIRITPSMMLFAP